eukprot:356430-Chlamydomonas_euryale.AAC.5
MPPLPPTVYLSDYLTHRANKLRISQQNFPEWRLPMRLLLFRRPRFAPKRLPRWTPATTYGERSRPSSSRPKSPASCSSSSPASFPRDAARGHGQVGTNERAKDPTPRACASAHVAWAASRRTPVLRSPSLPHWGRARARALPDGICKSLRVCTASGCSSLHTTDADPAQSELRSNRGRAVHRRLQQAGHPREPGTAERRA